MNLPDDKEFDLAVEKAIDEIFGAAKQEEITLVEDDSLKTPLELEPIEKEEEESKVIDFPNIDDLLETEEEALPEKGLTQKDLERLAAALLSLEWELTPENCFEFLTALEEAKQKSDPEIHEIFDIMHEVGIWLRDRSHEARPEWLHFLHQGIVALNLITIHGKEAKPYISHLKKGLARLASPPEEAPSEEKILDEMIKKLAVDYQRFVLFNWLFERTSRLRSWQKICQRAISEIEDLVQRLPPEKRPDLKALAENTLKKLKGKKIITPVSRPKEESAKLPFTAAYMCEASFRKFLVPAEEVAFIGPIKDNWQEALQKGHFPLKLLLGPWGFLPFVKLKNKLSGELAQKGEEELRSLVLPVLKDYQEGDLLLLLWKKDKGAALAIDNSEPMNIPEQARFIKDQHHPHGKIIINGEEYPVIMAEGLGNAS